MATVKKPKKYQAGGSATAKAILAKKAASDTTKAYDYSRDENDAPSWVKKINTGSKKPTPKAKSGGSFPDLNKDGKITKADVLKGRGVIAKKGVKVKAKAKVGCKACWGTKMKKK
jgi:hypothetical protein